MTCSTWEPGHLLARRQAGEEGVEGEVPSPSLLATLVPASRIVALGGRAGQSVNRSGAKKLAVDGVAAKRLRSQVVRDRLTRGS